MLLDSPICDFGWAVEPARAHVRRGIVVAPEFGKGRGPIGHAFD